MSYPFLSPRRHLIWSQVDPWHNICFRHGPTERDLPLYIGCYLRSPKRLDSHLAAAHSSRCDSQRDWHVHPLLQHPVLLGTALVYPKQKTRPIDRSPLLKYDLKAQEIILHRTETHQTESDTHPSMIERALIALESGHLVAVVLRPLQYPQLPQR